MGLWANEEKERKRESELSVPSESLACCGLCAPALFVFFLLVSLFSFSSFLFLFLFPLFSLFFFSSLVSLFPFLSPRHIVPSTTPRHAHAHFTHKYSRTFHSPSRSSLHSLPFSFLSFYQQLISPSIFHSHLPSLLSFIFTPSFLVAPARPSRRVSTSGRPKLRHFPSCPPAPTPLEPVWREILLLHSIFYIRSLVLLSCSILLYTSLPAISPLYFFYISSSVCSLRLSPPPRPKRNDEII